jgi:hypothetical protein
MLPYTILIINKICKKSKVKKAKTSKAIPVTGCEIP